MSEPFNRKAALRAYKEQKPRPGIFAVRHIDSGRAWADSSPNVDTTRNRVWHCLNDGRHLEKSLQAEWKRFGEAAFEFVILEVIEENLSPPFLKDALKAKKTLWAQVLSTPDATRACLPNAPAARPTGDHRG